MCFGGVVSFIFADLIVPPVLDIYRRYYGGRVALFILGSFYVTMVAAGHLIELLFGALGIIPTNRTVSAIEQGPSLNCTAVRNGVSWQWRPYSWCASCALAGRPCCI